jgi:hypothetical protein
MKLQMMTKNLKLNQMILAERSKERHLLKRLLDKRHLEKQRLKKKSLRMRRRTLIKMRCLQLDTTMTMTYTQIVMQSLSTSLDNIVGDRC